MTTVVETATATAIAIATATDGPTVTATERPADRPGRSVERPPLEFRPIEIVPSGSRVPSVQVTPSAAGATLEQSASEHELAVLLVEALNLEVAPADIDPNAPLYGEGLGLDSIDILEVALEVSRRYGFQLRSDDENNQLIFQSLRSLATHVAKHRST